MELRPCFRQIWSDDEGYVDSDEQIGFMVVDARGETIAYGESESDAWENAFETEFPAHRKEGGASAGAVAAR